MALIYLKDSFQCYPCQSTIKKTIKHALQLSTWSVKTQIVEGILNAKNRATPDDSDSLTEFKAKLTKNQLFIRKLQEEKKARKKIAELREANIRRALLDQEQIETLKKEKEDLQEALKKEERRQKIQTAINERKKSLSLLKELSSKEFRKVKSAVPLFKKFELGFISNYQIPELEKRKKVLSQRHEFFKPMDHESISSHSKNFRVKSPYKFSKPQIDFPNTATKSNLISKILEQDNAEIQEKLEKIQQRKSLLGKQRSYAKLVREMFTPIADSLKEKEMEYIKSKLKNPVIKRNFSEDAKRKEKLKFFKKGRIKITSAKTPDKRSREAKDYIKEIREERMRNFSSKNLLNDKRGDLSGIAGKRDLKKRINLIDRETRKKENLIQYSNPLSSIKKSSEINDLIVKSIRAKLIMLEELI